MKRIEIIFEKAHEAGLVLLFVVIGMVAGLCIGHWQITRAGNVDVRICETVTGEECVLMAVPAQGEQI